MYFQYYSFIYSFIYSTNIYYLPPAWHYAYFWEYGKSQWLKDPCLLGNQNLSTEADNHDCHLHIVISATLRLVVQTEVFGGLVDELEIETEMSEG